MSNEKEVEDFLAHFGKKGMKWGVRRAKKKQEKAEAVKQFRDSVIKDIGSRSPSELYAVRGKKGPTLIITGEEFVEKANIGMPFLSVQSTGMKIDDGR